MSGESKPASVACEFCGQEHPPAAPMSFVGVQIRLIECPNLPQSWLFVDGVVADLTAPTGRQS